MREFIETEFLPYELTAEQVAAEKMAEIQQKYGSNPSVIAANLELILQEYGHDCIELGMGLADSFPTLGVVDIMRAFAEGYEQAKGYDDGGRYGNSY